MEKSPTRIGTELYSRSLRAHVRALLLVFLLSGASGSDAQGVWVSQAPGPNTQGQVENIDEGEVVGSIHAVAVHPTDPDIVWVGTVNGGVWRTNDGMSSSPHWRPLTDGQPSLSIGALQLDPTDLTNQIVVAGTGCFSSYMCSARSAAGLLRTTDGGASWTVIDGAGTLIGLNVSGVAPRGSTIVISVNRALTPTDSGLWRSSNGGVTWEQISRVNGSGLPAGETPGLASHRTVPSTLFTCVRRKGLYRSLNTGATWKKVSNAAMDNKIVDALNVRIALGPADNVYVAIVGPNGRLSAVYRSIDGGTTWKAMGLPGTVEGGVHPGAQGGVHLSLAADPVEPNIVYIGGDAQPPGRSRFPVPNSIGATDYTGRLFRGNADKPVGSQWVHLTHSRTLGAAGGGTSNGSAPHADSRDLVVAPNGDLIEVDDGGIYRRTVPRSNTGAWYSMNGDIQVTELHSVAWDHNAKIVIGGAQDTGTPQQHRPSNVRWQSVSTSDGGVVAVEDIGSPHHSTRYSSKDELSDFRRQVYNTANFPTEDDYPDLTIVGRNGKPEAQFYSPVALNTGDPERLIIGGRLSLYESFDRGETVHEIGPGIAVNASGGGAVSYGAPGNPEVLYVGSGASFFARVAANPVEPQKKTGYPGGAVVDIALDPIHPMTAFVVDPAHVYRTSDGGSTWTELSSDLTLLAPGELRSVAYGWSNTGMVVVGADTGVFAATGPAYSSWSRLGCGLPRAPVLQLELDSVDGVLVAATLGRGAWTLPTPPAQLPPPPPVAAETKSIATLDMEALGPSPKDGETAFQLQPGLWIDRVASRAYLMAPNGGIEAVDLTTGATVWSTEAVAKPLGLVGRFLVGQVDTPEGGNGIRLAVLDAVDGHSVLTKTVELPAGVKPLVEETAGSTFEAVARGVGREAVITWEFSERTERGIHPLAKTVLPPPPSDPPPVGAFTPNGSNDEPADSIRRGAFELDLETRAVSAMGSRSIPFAQVTHSEVVMSKSLSPGSVNQVLSADGRHAVVSERVEAEDGGNRYRLTFYERDSGRRLGEMRSRLPVLFFVISGPRVIFETRPFARRSGVEMVWEPRSVRAVDLATGVEMWRRPLRDTTYRGPHPP